MFPNIIMMVLALAVVIGSCYGLVKLSSEARKATRQLQSPNLDPKLLKLSVKTASRIPYVVSGITALVFGALRATDSVDVVDVTKYGVAVLFVATFWLGFRLYKRRYVPLLWAPILSLGFGSAIGFFGASLLGL